MQNKMGYLKLEPIKYPHMLLMVPGGSGKTASTARQQPEKAVLISGFGARGPPPPILFCRQKGSGYNTGAEVLFIER